MTKTEFINTLGTLAHSEVKKRNKWVLPSICIAQAALETGWGNSSLMSNANAFFGIKASSSWKGKVYNSQTKECYDGVTYTTITDCFRAYDSLVDSVADYYDLITCTNRYALAVNNKDAASAITAIKNGGYATDPTYITKIMGIVNNNNLTIYDSIIINKLPSTLGNMKSTQISNASATPTSSEDKMTSTINVTYQVYTSSDKWLPIIKNYNMNNSNGYAGISGNKIQGIRADLTKGHIKYRVHTINGKWLPWVVDSNTVNAQGYAGIYGMDIDAIQMQLSDLIGYDIEYRVSTLSGDYLPWVRNHNEVNADGYAGIYGKAIDKLQIRIVKK